jgi:hypothetical protein
VEGRQELTRSEMWGDRQNRIQGGQPEPVFLVTIIYANADPNRGIRGLESSSIVEIYPRPTFVRVTTQQMTQLGSIVQAGDYSMRLPGRFVDANQLEDQQTQIKWGGAQDSLADGKLFRIVRYDPEYLGGQVAYYNLYVRGVPKHG